MRKVTLLFSAGMIGGIVSGVMGLFQGAGQKAQGQAEEDLSNKQYDNALDSISPNNDPILTGQQNSVRRIMSGLQSGTGGGYANNQLNEGVVSGANAITGLSGGNTGAALATINSLHNNLSDVYGKQEAQNQAYVNSLLGLDSNLSSEISTENQGNNDKRAQFWKMRGEQNLSRALSDKKSGQMNQNAGASSLTSSIEDIMGGSGGSGGSGSSGGGIMGMLGGMMGGGS